VSYDKLFDYKISVTLTCKTCGVEWRPSNKNAGYGANLQDDGRFRCGITIADVKCPVCTAHEAVIAGFRGMQEAARMEF
jgi:hypothetical protein